MKQNTIVLCWKRSTNNIDNADQTEPNEKKSAELGAPYKRIKHNITVDITKVKKSDDTHLR